MVGRNGHLLVPQRVVRVRVDDLRGDDWATLAWLACWEARMEALQVLVASPARVPH